MRDAPPVAAAFPDGESEQITFGPAEEKGLAIAPDGRSLITSVGLRKSSVWIRDSKGERAIFEEENAATNYLLLSAPRFSRMADIYVSQSQEKKQFS